MQGLPGMNKLVNVYRTPFVLTGFTGVFNAITPLARRSQTVVVNSGGVGLELHDHVFSQAKLVDPMLSLAWSVARTVPGNDPLSLVALAEGMSGAPSLDEIPPFAGPSLLFNGSDDAVAAGIDRIAGRLSNAQRLVVPGRHHLSTLTARALKERAVAFLDIDGD